MDGRTSERANEWKNTFIFRRKKADGNFVDVAMKIKSDNDDAEEEKDRKKMCQEWKEEKEVAKRFHYKWFKHNQFGIQASPERKAQRNEKKRKKLIKSIATAMKQVA